MKNLMRLLLLSAMLCAGCSKARRQAFDELVTGQNKGPKQPAEVMVNVQQFGGNVLSDHFAVTDSGFGDTNKVLVVEICNNQGACTPLPFNSATYLRQGSILQIYNCQTAAPTCKWYHIYLIDGLKQ